MPAGVHLKRARTYRPDPDVYDRARAAVEAMGDGKDATMNAYINAFLKWLVHDTDELPQRPPKQEGDGDIPQGDG
ncbi:hypothetical protein [Streptomyces sp. bgisy154]|uniref:hypothetical protein n=1 Tax=Streptomyces sp. bgisy154 TaxID=3413794 RepID=UPI003D7369A4